MSHADDNKSVAGFVHDGNDEPIYLGFAGATYVPPTIGNVVFQVTSPMLHLQIKGLFGAKAVEDSNLHLCNFMDVCLPSKMRNISQEYFRLRLFPFSLNGESTS